MEEEVLFRLMGIAAILWLVRRRWIAIIIPGILWALAHLTYVRDPFYMRGIELLVVAIFYALIFLKYDLTTTIVAHATYNALLGALPMLRSGETYFVFSGISVILILVSPAMPGFFLWFKKRSALTQRKPEIYRLMKDSQSDWSVLKSGGTDWTSHLANPQAIVVCVELDNKVIGAAAGILDENNQGEIIALYIDPEWRRQYWGSRLISSLEEELRAIGITRINVEADMQDRVSVAFWAALGWRPVSKVLTQAALPSLGGLTKETWRMIRKKELN